MRMNSTPYKTQKTMPNPAPIRLRQSVDRQIAFLALHLPNQTSILYIE
jgi:hypothetical protein